MRAKNTTPGPLEVDGGRSLPAGTFGDVNSRDPLVSRHLDAGRLVRPRRRPDPTPEPEHDAPDPEHSQPPAEDVGTASDPEQE